MEQKRSYANRLTLQAVTLTAASLLVAGCTADTTRPSSSAASAHSMPAGEADPHFTGGCDTFRVYAQNRWTPYGTAVRVKPDVQSAKLDPSFAPNEIIAVDGWVRGAPTYPTNPAPWNRNIYFHLATREGWVSYPGVRGGPSEPDPTLHSPDGGIPAPLLPECKGAYQP
jgi:hypothetical protein